MDSFAALGEEVIQRPGEPPLGLRTEAGHLEQYAALHELALPCAREGHGEEVLLYRHVDLLLERRLIPAEQRIGLLDRRGAEQGAEVPPAHLHAGKVSIHFHVFDRFARAFVVQNVAVGGELLLQDVHVVSRLIEKLLFVVDRVNLLIEACELLLAGVELLAVDVNLPGQGLHVAALLARAGLNLLLQGSQAGLKGLYMGVLCFGGIGELPFLD